MKGLSAALLALLLPLAARAQQAPPQPAPPAEAAPAPAAPDQPPPPPAWLPRPAAALILLDKISAQPRTVRVQVGQTVAFGSLSIAVRACDVRPPDRPADAAALLDITDANPGMPDLHGWILAAEPAAAMLQHPIYDVRLAGCAG